MTDDTLCKVASFAFLYQAQAAQLHLDAEGIESWLDGAEFVNADWALGNAVGDVKVQVRASDFERGRQILEKMTSPRSSPSTEDSSSEICLACGDTMDVDAVACPSCGWSFLGDSEAFLSPDEPQHEAEPNPYQSPRLDINGDRSQSNLSGMRKFALFSIKSYVYLLILSFAFTIGSIIVFNLSS